MQHARESKNNGGRIPYGPKSILSKGQNRFGTRFNPVDIRPIYNNLRESGRSADGKTIYRTTSTRVERFSPERPWRGKSERRQVTAERRS